MVMMRSLPYLKGLEECTLACPMAWSLWAVAPQYNDIADVTGQETMQAF